MKKYLFLCTALWVSLWASAQATDLVVDCQTPGWLSSKINYGDQQTVKNLKVTGYINQTDLAFIGSLTQLSLNGIIDLGDVFIVGNSWNGTFKQLTNSWESDYSFSIKKLVLPKGLKNYNEAAFVKDTYVDTLVFDTQVHKIEGYDSAHRNYRTDTDKTLERKIGHLIIGENVDTIISVGYAQTVHFPNSLRFLDNYACNKMIISLLGYHPYRC